jgi:hypothetical protein
VATHTHTHTHTYTHTHTHIGLEVVYTVNTVLFVNFGGGEGLPYIGMLIWGPG